jgi:hypothetical protein
MEFIMNKVETIKALKAVKNHKEFIELVESVLSDDLKKNTSTRGDYNKSDDVIKVVEAYAKKHKGEVSIVDLRSVGVSNPNYITEVMVKRGILERLPTGKKSPGRGRPSVTYKLA